MGGCGYCLSTLQCVDGTAIGPSDGSPCPSWIFEAGVCPGKSWELYVGSSVELKAAIWRDIYTSIYIGQAVR